MLRELLRASAQALNGFAGSRIANGLVELSDADPWHVCFAIGRCRGMPRMGLPGTGSWF